MKADYICNYIHNSGKICGKACIRPEGCRLHYNTKNRYPCLECGKPTGSSSGRCYKHVRGYYQIQYYRKLREKAEKFDLGMLSHVNSSSHN